MISLRPGRRAAPAGGSMESEEAADLPPAPLVTLANRLPVVKTRSGWRTADGGLVAALRPTLETRPTTWVGWDGGSADLPHVLPDLAARLVPVSLRKALVESYYHGFSNRTLWPLFHGLADRVVIERRWWRDYCAVNERFAHRALEVAPPNALLWVHDYQLVCVLTAPHPISIDAGGLSAQARSGHVRDRLEKLRRQFGERRVLVGVDRLDYTKGIVERLRAIELLLERRREFRGQLVVLQIAVPSRGDIREYRELRSEVEQTVGRINGRFTNPGQDVPIHYLYRGVSADRLLAHYAIADICMVTPLRD